MSLQILWRKKTSKYKKILCLCSFHWSGKSMLKVLIVQFKFNLILIKFLWGKIVQKPKEFAKDVLERDWMSKNGSVEEKDRKQKKVSVNVSYSTLLFHVVHLFMFCTCFSSIFMAQHFPVPQIHSFLHSLSDSCCVLYTRLYTLCVVQY